MNSVPVYSEYLQFFGMFEVDIKMQVFELLAVFVIFFFCVFVCVGREQDILC